MWASLPASLVAATVTSVLVLLSGLVRAGPAHISNFFLLTYIAAGVAGGIGLLFSWMGPKPSPKLLVVIATWILVSSTLYKISGLHHNDVVRWGFHMQHYACLLLCAWISGALTFRILREDHDW
jgi:hypothetical protein